MRASTLCFRSAVLLILAGMVWGLQMAISGDHVAFPGHAHLNLMGFVSLFLFGLFYRAFPAVEAGGLAVPQVVVWVAASVLIGVGVGLVHSGYPQAEPVAAIGSIVAILGMLLFAWMVFRASDGPETGSALRL